MKIISEDSKILAGVLRECQSGQTVEYSTLSKAIGVQDVRSPATRGFLTTARNMVQRENRIVFASVRGVGLKRLDDADKVVVTGEHNKRARRAVNRGLRVAETIDETKLDNEQRKSLYTQTAMAGAVKMFTGSKAQKTIGNSQQAKESAERISFQDTLRLFSDK